MPRKKSPRKVRQAQTVSAPLLVFDMRELAGALRISNWSARRLIELGEIPAIALPAVSHGTRRRSHDQRMKRILVRVADVESYLARKVQPGR